MKLNRVTPNKRNPKRKKQETPNVRKKTLLFEKKVIPDCSSPVMSRVIVAKKDFMKTKPTQEDS
jgi:hypothetical protein